MKKILRIIAGSVLCMLLLTTMAGCNYSPLDTKFNFAYAYIELPNGELVEGKVENWRDYSDGDQIQVTINGVTYLTDTTRCVLCSEKPGD